MAVEHVITDDRRAFYSKIVDVTVWVSQWGVLVQSYAPHVETRSQNLRFIRGAEGEGEDEGVRGGGSQTSPTAVSPLKRLQPSFRAAAAARQAASAAGHHQARLSVGEEAQLASRRASQAAEYQAVKENLLKATREGQIATTDGAASAAEVSSAAARRLSLCFCGSTCLRSLQQRLHPHPVLGS